jgi:hypothetical protein
MTRAGAGVKERLIIRLHGIEATVVNWTPRMRISTL